MWYGLLVNGDLRVIQWFNRPPLLFDFHLGFFSSDNDYDVVIIDPVIVGSVPAYL